MLLLESLVSTLAEVATASAVTTTTVFPPPRLIGGLTAGDTIFGLALFLSVAFFLRRLVLLLLSGRTDGAGAGNDDAGVGNLQMSDGFLQDHRIIRSAAAYQVKMSNLVLGSHSCSRDHRHVIPSADSAATSFGMTMIDDKMDEELMASPPGRRPASLRRPARRTSSSGSSSGSPLIQSYKSLPVHGLNKFFDPSSADRFRAVRTQLLRSEDQVTDRENDHSRGDFSSASRADQLSTPTSSLPSSTCNTAAESLLQKVFPAPVIDQLKAGRHVDPEYLGEVSILFTDIVGYTDISSRTPTLQLMGMLDCLFSAFDDLTEQHGVFKVETIGDAYMCVAGHKTACRHDHTKRLMGLAEDMLSVASKIKVPCPKNGTVPLQIRVGIHTGPAYGGVVGHARPRYCLFGDAVNVASRMESTSFPQCIQVSDTTYQTHQRLLQAASAKCATRKYLTWHHSASTHTAAPPSSSASGAGDSPVMIAATRRGTNDEYSRCHDLGKRPIKGKGHMRTWLVKAGGWQDAVTVHNSTSRRAESET